MNYTFYIKISEKVIEEGYYQKIINKDVAYFIDNYLRKKSLRLINPVIKVGKLGTDFVDNFLSVVVNFDGYKVPRIVKSMFLKDKKRRIKI